MGPMTHAQKRLIETVQASNRGVPRFAMWCQILSLPVAVVGTVLTVVFR